MQYPPQMGRYKVETQSGHDWKSADTVRIMVSVGQKYHEGEKFKATVDWAHGRFKKVVICVSDTLQRYNFMMKGIPSEESYWRALQAGNKWVERNQKYFKNAHVDRWSDWLSDQNFPSHLKAIEHFYLDSCNFRSIIKSSAKDVWSRRIQRKQITPSDPMYDFNQFFKYSKDFLIEEIAVFSCMLDKEPNALDVYPGSPILVFEIYSEEKNVPDILKHRKFLRIDYVRNKSFTAEQQVAA